MPVLDLIFLGLLLLSALVLVGSAVRTFPRLANLDVDALPQQQQADMKFGIIEARIERKIKQASFRLTLWTQPIGVWIQNGIHRLSQMVGELEKKVRREQTVRTPELTMEGQEAARKKTAELMDRGSDLVKQEQYGDAEKKFIEVLSYEPKNVEAFRALSEVYSLKKEWDHVRDLLLHLKKLSPMEASTDHRLGEIYLLKQHPKSAIRFFQSAVETEGSNPKYLTSLLETAISLKRKVLAVTTLRALKGANPDNQRIAEFEKQVDEI